MFYDCHTYQEIKQDDIFSIINYTLSNHLKKECFYSVGIHPWRVSQTNFSNTEWEEVLKISSDSNVLAIGECGLDRLHANLDFQKEIFKQHIDLAEKLQKPLIIHCVKAFVEILKMLENVSVPIIIHGVNNRTKLIQQFLDRGYYLSFGANILLEKSISRSTILDVPKNQLLLETDEKSAPIQQIYHETTKLLNIAPDELISVISNNMQKIFQW